jgi:hypothetical protein
MRKCTKSWLDTYIEYTRHQEAPRKFHTWIGLYILASTVTRNVYIDRKLWKIFPNLYVGIIGPTGDGKTTAGDIGNFNILRQIPNLELIIEKATSYYLLELLNQLTQTKGRSCCSLYAPEMKSFIGDLNKTELVTFLTSMYTCPDSTEYRTKGQLQKGGIYKLKNICINLLACSTPEWLTTGTTTDDISGGFTGRFVYIYEDKIERKVPFPEDFVTSDVKKLQTNLVDDLKHIQTLKGPCVITDQAKAAYIIWYTDRQKECKDERLRGYFARKRDLVFKIAMLLSLSEDDYLVIDEKILEKTWHLLTDTEVNMADAFSGVVDDPGMKYKDTVLSQISVSPGHKLTRSELLRKNWNRFDGVVLDRIVSNLVDAQMVKVGTVVTPNGKEPAYILNENP